MIATKSPAESQYFIVDSIESIQQHEFLKRPHRWIEINLNACMTADDMKCVLSIQRSIIVVCYPDINQFMQLASGHNRLNTPITIVLNKFPDVIELSDINFDNMLTFTTDDTNKTDSISKTIVFSYANISYVRFNGKYLSSLDLSFRSCNISNVHVNAYTAYVSVSVAGGKIHNFRVSHTEFIAIEESDKAITKFITDSPYSRSPFVVFDTLQVELDKLIPALPLLDPNIFEATKLELTCYVNLPGIDLRRFNFTKPTSLSISVGNSPIDFSIEAFPKVISFEFWPGTDNLKTLPILELPKLRWLYLIGPYQSKLKEAFAELDPDGSYRGYLSQPEKLRVKFCVYKSDKASKFDHSSEILNPETSSSNRVKSAKAVK